MDFNKINVIHLNHFLLINLIHIFYNVTMWLIIVIFLNSCLIMNHIRNHFLFDSIINFYQNSINHFIIIK
jgi:hypothetical protein